MAYDPEMHHRRFDSLAGIRLFVARKVLRNHLYGGQAAFVGTHRRRGDAPQRARGLPSEHKACAFQPLRLFVPVDMPVSRSVGSLTRSIVGPERRC